MTERKIICKIITGSRLYGTNRPDSDEDYTGVFLPSTNDLLGLQNCPAEWTENVKKSEGNRNSKGDIDCKFFSLQKFFNLAAQGQPAQLELLFAPESAKIIATPEWEEILSHRNLFMSKNSIAPFVGFALAQSYKATLKGENLNQIRAIIAWGNKLTQESLNHPLMDFLEVLTIGCGTLRIINTKIDVKTLINDFGYQLVEVAGRQYDINLKAKTFLDNMKDLEDRYGFRSEVAAIKGYDYKSLMHAYRLLDEAKEFLETGNITMPRPQAEFLKNIRDGNYYADYFNEIASRINYIQEVVQPGSNLPKAPDRARIEELCQSILYRHLFGKP